MQSSKEAIITKVLDQGKSLDGDSSQEFQKLELKLADSDEYLEIFNQEQPFSRWNPYEAGQRVTIQNVEQQNWIITDYVRRPALLKLFLIFVFLVVAIGKWWGVRSLLSLISSFAIIFGMIIPLILKGYNPLLIALAGALIIVPITFYLSHGFKKKTHVAVAGTMISLLLSGLLAANFMLSAHLTGFSSEEAGFLSVMTDDSLDIRGLLLAGIIISLLGTLDDVAVSQASFVQQLREVSPKASFKDLFTRAMKVGQDHISSMVNTLVLVYAGASLPLLLLFFTSDASAQQIINLEIVAEEIVRTLTGSIGVVLAAPITTLIAALVFSKKDKELKPKK